MLIIPAITIKNGHCVYLSSRHEDGVQSVDGKHGYSNDPVDIVGRWFDKGLNRIHLLDLDGAFEGRTINADLICQIAFRFPNLSLQVSGGLRSLADIERYINAGIDYVVLGSKAVQDSEFVLKVAQLFPKQIMVAIKVNSDNKVMTKAKTETTALDAFSFAQTFDQPGIAGIVYSEASAEEAIDIDKVARLAALMTVPVLAFGGIENMDDIRALYAESHKGIVAAIAESDVFGNRLDTDQPDTGRLDIVDAQKYCDEFED